MTNDGYRMTNKIVGQGFSLAFVAVLMTTILYLTVSCAPFIWTQHARQKKAQKEVLKSLNVVEKRIEVGKSSGEEFNEAVDLLEEVTGIKGHREHQFLTDYFKHELLKPDYEKWKDWYEKNKDRLYWDERQKRIVVKGREIPEQKFYLASVEAKDIIKIGDYTLTFYPDWCPTKIPGDHKFTSPDFQKEITIEQKGTEYQLLLRERGEGSSRKVIDVSKLGFSAPDWNREGKKIVYLRVNSVTEDFNYGDIVINDITSQAQTILKKNLAYSDPKWSPDGTKIVFSDFGSIFIIDANGKTETQIREGAYPEWCSGICWHPDGYEIAFTQWTSVHHEELGKQILSIRIGEQEQ